jgi:hypothetical protein
LEGILGEKVVDQVGTVDGLEEYYQEGVVGWVGRVGGLVEVVVDLGVIQEDEAAWMVGMEEGAVGWVRLEGGLEEEVVA